MKGTCLRLIAPVVVLLSLVRPSSGQFVFQPPADIPLGFSAYTTAAGVGDLNHDGHLDIVTTGRNVLGVVSILMGNADGGFDPPVDLTIDEQTDWVEVGSFDNDANLDLVLAYRTGRGKIAFLKGNGDGTFQGPVEYPLGRRPSHFIPADLDGDLDLDLAVTHYLSETIAVLLNDGNGNFTPAQEIHVGRLSRGTAQPFYMTCGDLDGDADIDIAVGMASAITVITNEGNAQFSRPIHVAVGDNVGTPAGLAAGDMDNDGDLDIVYAELTLLGQPGNLAILTNQGGGLFQGVTKYPTGNTLWFVSLIDVDGDGLLDPVVSDALEGTVTFFHNENSTPGELALSAPLIIDTGGFPRSMRPFDLDDDCDTDIVVANIGSHGINLLINDTPQANPCRSGSLAPAAAHPVLKTDGHVRAAFREPIGADGLTARNLRNVLADWGTARKGHQRHNRQEP